MYNRTKVFAAVTALFMFMSVGTQASMARGKVAVVAVEHEYPAAESVNEIAQMLGYSSELIRGDVVSDPARLKEFDCVILPGRHSILYEEEYAALAEYVKGGGTLFLTDSAGLALAVNPDNRLENYERPRGRIEPLQKATGIDRIGGRGVPVKFRVVERNAITRDLPDEFSYETRPPHDVDAPPRWTRIYDFELDGADVLVEVEALFNGEKRTVPFVTAHGYGDGRAVRAGCFISRLIDRYSEGNMLRIFSNVLEASME